MRTSVFVIGFAVVFFAPGCVTERRGADGAIAADEVADDGKLPLDLAQDRVRAEIGDLPRLTGRHLLSAMDRIAAYRAIAIVPIAERIDDPDPFLRSHLVYVLGRIGGPDAHRLLASRIADTDPIVRFESAAALLDAGDLGGVPVLVKMLREPDRKLRYKSIEALKRFTKQDFGYDFAADEPQRERAVAQWDAWWTKTRAELIYAGGGAPSPTPSK
jgi:hypothetical protein